MISKIRIINFRQIIDQTIELTQSVVVAGPNNGGKTTLLQAISLFSLAIRAWGEQRIDKKSKASKRTGVAINLEDMTNIPVSEFKELWTNLIVREGVVNPKGKHTTKNIRIKIHAEGYTDNKFWQIGFEFDYGRDTLIYARLTSDENGNLYDFPEILLNEKIGYLPSIAGLKPVEDKLEIGSILRNIGYGNTSDVLRNICFLLFEKSDKSAWNEFREIIEQLFKIELNPPRFIPLTGLLKMSYNEGSKKNIDLSSLGSGCKQAILLFAYILAFPNTVNLLDEPDAHLEVIRQSNIYDRISDLAKKNNSQLIIASHSESVLKRAFGKDLVLSGVFGQFEKVNHISYITSVLRDIGYEEFLIAKQRPNIFYFEGTTDFDFMKAFCNKLNKKNVSEFLENFVYPYPVGNNVNKVKNHFASLKNFIPELKAFALFDNLNKDMENNQEGLLITQWSRNEFENYIPLPQTLEAYADSETIGLFRDSFMAAVYDATPPAALRDPKDNFWITTKISDNYLTPLFEKFFDSIDISRNIMDKSKFYQLVEYCDTAVIDDEIIAKIDLIEKHYGL